MNNQPTQEQLVNGIISTIERSLDDELDKLDQIGGSDLEKIREQRLKDIKETSRLNAERLSKGHGEYNEIDEKEFFKAIKDSPDMVVHFYKNDSPRCKIFDHHLKILAPKHIEAKFVKLDVEKSPFLTNRLEIRVIPTLLVSVGGKTVAKIVGFSDLGNRDDFKTSMLKWRLGVTGVIKNEDEMPDNPFASGKKSGFSRVNKKTIRENSSSDSDSD